MASSVFRPFSVLAHILSKSRPLFTYGPEDYRPIAPCIPVHFYFPIHAGRSIENIYCLRHTLHVLCRPRSHSASLPGSTQILRPDEGESCHLSCAAERQSESFPLTHYPSMPEILDGYDASHSGIPARRAPTYRDGVVRQTNP